MKNISVFVIVLAIGFGFASCKKNGTKLDSDITLSFQTQVNGQNFGLEEVYSNDEMMGIKFELFQFYLSDIELINSDGDKRLLSEIELIKIDENGFFSKEFEVPKGHYESVSFGIGVKSSLNDADPANYAIDGHPLNITENTYWGWTGKYRFVMSEGRFDEEFDSEFEGTFAYHTGHDVSYRTLELEHSFQVKKKKENKLNFVIDLYQFLDRAGNRVNPSETPFYHGSTEDEALTIKLSDNFMSSISIVD